jgi:OmpA-OmpF porin, OOP family
VQPGKPVPVAKPAAVPPPAAARGPGGRPLPGAAAPAGAAAILAPTAAPANVRRVDDVRSQRKETRDGSRTVIREPGRTIIKDGNLTVIRRDENNRFRYGARNMIAERRGNEIRTMAVRPDGSRIINVTDDSGRLMRRMRRDRFGREVIIIDNHRPGMSTGAAIGIGVAAGLAAGLGVAYLANVPPPVITIPQDQYIVDARYAPPAMLYDTFAAPPIGAIERPYTLDEIRYTPALRQQMRSVDINTLTFDTGSFELRPEQYPQLEAIANAIKQVIDGNPDEVFLIEGHTDAVGTEEDNLSLSDRRAEAIAVVLTEQFQIPPENLTNQGYGETQLKVPVQGPSEENRRVTVRRITPLLAGKQ